LAVIRLGAAVELLLDAHIDFFEAIGKFWAGRRISARWLRDRYGATDERAMLMRFHTQTARVSLTAQQPDNNIVWTSIDVVAECRVGDLVLEPALDALVIPEVQQFEKGDKRLVGVNCRPCSASPVHRSLRSAASNRP
jgi:methylmalonyl-CoA mutase, N-terminal domain